MSNSNGQICIILEFPSPLSYADGTPGTNRRGWLPATDAAEITLAIRAGAEFIGVATTAGEVREMMEADKPPIA